MNRQIIRRVVAGLVMALSLSFLTGIISTPEAQAQSRNRSWQRDRDDRRDNDRYRYWRYRQQREWERNRNRDWNGSRRNYPNYGGSGGYYGYNNSELQRGFRNGQKEGLDDARDRDSFNPSRHSSFRDGNPSYREGFRRGYQEGYRQYAYSRRW